MLWTIAVIMLVLWVLGLVSSYTLGGFIHLLLVAAIVLVAVRLIQGRSVHPVRSGPVSHEVCVKVRNLRGRTRLVRAPAERRAIG